MPSAAKISRDLPGLPTPRLRRSLQSRRSLLEEVASLRPVTEAPLLLSRSSSRPLAGTLRRQDAPDYDQRGRVEEYGGEAAFPAVRSPPPGPVACAHAREAPGAVAVPRGVRGGPRLRGPRGPLPCVGADAGHLAQRGGEVATCRSALPAWHLLGPWTLICSVRDAPPQCPLQPRGGPDGTSVPSVGA